MEAIFPITDLRRNAAAVQEAAQNGLVHITEGGRGAYVFCTERVLDDLLRQAAEEAVYAERMAASIRASKADIAAGRSYEGTDEVLAAIEEAARG